MKKTLEIECPDGYKPVYDAETGKVEIIPEDLTKIIKTHEDAGEYRVTGTISYNESVNALAELHKILETLNDGYKFDLLEGDIWFPFVKFCRGDAVKGVGEKIGSFYYRGELFTLVGGCYFRGCLAGLGSFDSNINSGIATSSVGMLACKSKRIAGCVSVQFGKLIFEAYFARYFANGEFEWVE